MYWFELTFELKTIWVELGQNVVIHYLESDIHKDICIRAL